MTQKLQNSINNGYNVNIGNYFSRGYDIMKSDMGNYIGFAALAGLIVLVANFIPLVNLLAGILITPSLFFGFHIVSNSIAAKGKLPIFSEFFNGFNHFGKIVVISLLTTVITVIVFVPVIFMVGFGAIGSILTAGAAGSQASREAIMALIGSMGIGMLLTVLVLIYISASLMFSMLIAVFHNEEPVEAMKLSWKVVNKNWLMWIVFIIVMSFLIFAGALFCLVGLVFALPLYYCIMYAAFEDVCGLPETDGDHQDEISTIGAGLS
jgi:hypothetical protein